MRPTAGVVSMCEARKGGSEIQENIIVFIIYSKHPSGLQNHCLRCSLHSGLCEYMHMIVHSFRCKHGGGRLQTSHSLAADMRVVSRCLPANHKGGIHLSSQAWWQHPTSLSPIRYLLPLSSTPLSSVTLSRQHTQKVWNNLHEIPKMSNVSTNNDFKVFLHAHIYN